MLTLAAIIVFFLRTLRVVYTGADAYDSLTAAIFAEAATADLVKAHNTAMAIIIGHDSPGAGDALSYRSVHTYLTAMDSTPDTHAVHVAQYVAAHAARVLTDRDIATTTDSLGYITAA